MLVDINCEVSIDEKIQVNKSVHYFVDAYITIGYKPIFGLVYSQ